MFNPIRKIKKYVPENVFPEFGKIGKISGYELAGYPVLIPETVFNILSSKLPEPEELPEIEPVVPEFYISEIPLTPEENTISTSVKFSDISQINGLVVMINPLNSDQTIELQIPEKIETDNTFQLQLPENTGVYQINYLISYADGQTESTIRYFSRIPGTSPDELVFNYQSDYETQRDNIRRRSEGVEEGAKPK